MVWLRRGFVQLLSLVLFLSLLGGVWALDINHSFSQPGNLKTWLRQSGVYDKATQAALNDAQQNENKNGSDGSVSLTDPTVKQAAEQSFTPQLAESSVDSIIDANYAWLQGKTTKPQFSVDLSGAKADFASKVGQAVTARLKSLPVCTPAQEAQLQLPVNVFSVSCRPAALNPITEGNRVRDDINTNSDFLNQPVITADNLNQANNSQATNQKPYYAKLSVAPKLYRLGQKLPLILAALALLCIIGIIFIALTRRRGFRRIGVVLSVAGVVLLASKFAADQTVNTLTRQKLTGAAGDLAAPRDNLLHAIESSLIKFDLAFGATFLIIGLVIFVYLYMTRQSVAKPKFTPAASAAADPAASGPQPKPIDLPTTGRPPLQSANDLNFKRSQPKPKKPPRLIQ